jgi:hypothetical protein
MAELEALADTFSASEAAAALESGSQDDKVPDDED